MCRCAPRARSAARRAARAAARRDATPRARGASSVPAVDPAATSHVGRWLRAALPRLLHCQRMLHCQQLLHCQRLLHCRARTYVSPISGTCALLHEIGTFDALGALSADDVRARALGRTLGRRAARRRVAQSGIKLI